MTARAFEARFTACADPQCPVLLPGGGVVNHHAHPDPDQPATCLTCLGWGTVGRGNIPRGDTSCPECGGKGWVP
jgi:hypothetical protein